MISMYQLLIQMLKHADRKLNIQYIITTMYCRLKNRAIKRNIPYLERSEFVELASKSTTLKTLFDIWVLSGFERKLAPTVDRIIPEKGYIIENIQFLNLSENASKGNMEIPRTMPVSQNKKPIKISKDQQELVFKSGREACDFLGVTRSQACLAIKNNRLLKGWVVSYA